MRPRLMLAVLAVLTISLAGCGSEQVSPEGGPDAAVVEPDVSGMDGFESDAATPDLGTDGEFEMGTNALGQSVPANFTPMSEGGEVPFVFGVQGSWMVVLAFRTHDILEGKFDVRAEISIGGAEPDEIWLELQETFPGGNGWDYYYNLFLAITGEPPPVGTPMRITMSVVDEDGTTAELAHDVVAGPADGPGR